MFYAEVLVDSVLQSRDYITQPDYTQSNRVYISAEVRTENGQSITYYSMNFFDRGYILSVACTHTGMLKFEFHLPEDSEPPFKGKQLAHLIVTVYNYH